MTTIHSTIEIRSISKVFEIYHSKSPISVFEKFSLSLDSSEIQSRESGVIFCFLGQSGCGKSTLLNIISGLDRTTSGTVWLNGELVEYPTTKSGLVPQAYTCFPWLNAFDNVAFGLQLNGVGKDECQFRAERHLRQVGLLDRWDAYPHQLSGGMKQRVALARTLALNPSVLLMDEPFGALDAQTRGEMQQLLLKVVEEQGCMVVFVTHDITEAVFLADRVYILPSRPVSQVKASFDIDFHHPRQEKLQHAPEFTNKCSIIRSLLSN